MNRTTDQNYYNCNKPWSLSWLSSVQDRRSTCLFPRHVYNQFRLWVFDLMHQIWYLYYQCTPQ